MKNLNLSQLQKVLYNLLVITEHYATSSLFIITFCIFID